MRALAGATGFLTRLPVGSRMRLDETDLVRGALLFPIVGAALGGLVGGTGALLGLALPALLAAALAVSLEVAITGALHVDALADSADGLAGRDRTHTLAIMRDHALGTYGACALVLDLLAKVLALGTLVAEAETFVLVAAFAVSRAAPLPLAALLPYARPGGGTGALLADRLGVVAAGAGVVLALAIAVAASGPWAGVAFGSLVLASGVVGVAAWRRLRGVTGDVMGAAIELTATLAVVLAAGTRA
jgi:adenosylcobinamide-GDP ribazoletransferase